MTESLNISQNGTRTAPMLKKAYLEITNSCNLSCSFCHKTKRDIRFISKEEFTRAAGELRGHTEYLYFHLMGEPLLHPLLQDFLDIAHGLGFKVIITTNGTLLKKKKDILLSSQALHKVSISLHSFEANESSVSMDEYLADCLEFCNDASKKGIISVVRLWNIGGQNDQNGKILQKIEDHFGSSWSEVYSGYKIKDKVFLEWGEKFDWPDIDAELISSNHSCYGLRDQVGVLSDGSVVPCCLDADGAITLGNIFKNSLDEILSSKRATDLKRSFENRKITEPLCARCGVAAMKFSK